MRPATQRPPWKMAVSKLSAEVALWSTAMSSDFLIVRQFRQLAVSADAEPEPEQLRLGIADCLA